MNQNFWDFEDVEEYKDFRIYLFRLRGGEKYIYQILSGHSSPELLHDGDTIEHDTYQDAVSDAKAKVDSWEIDAFWTGD